MEVHGPLADAEDGGDLPGGLALAGPEQALLLPIRQLGQVLHQIRPALYQLKCRVEDVAGAERQQGNVFKHQIGIGLLLADEGEDAVFPLRRVQREGDAVSDPEVGGQVHHLPAGAGQPGGVAVELVPEDGLGLLQSQEDDRVLSQVVPLRIGIEPAGGAVVEQRHMGFLHADGENNQQTEVIKAHLMTEALQLLLDVAGLLGLGEPIDVFPDRIVEHELLLFRSLSH